MSAFRLVEIIVRRQKFPLIAVEGAPFVFGAAILGFLLYRFVDPFTVPASLGMLAFLVLLFRDPSRTIPAEPLGILSPVDGVVDSISEAPDGKDMQVLHLRVRGFGSYTARAPIEGKIGNLRAREDGDRFGSHALWLQTDEGDDVMLRFDGLRLGIPPRGLKGYGERFGQGQRCAYLRLAARATLFVPGQSQVLVAAGDALTAGETLLGRLPSP